MLTPDDVRMILDAPNVRIITLVAGDDAIVATWVCADCLDTLPVCHALDDVRDAIMLIGWN